MACYEKKIPFALFLDLLDVCLNLDRQVSDREDWNLPWNGECKQPPHPPSFSKLL